jgi:GH15 family glucan-1,4-alpha-glucosidase
MAARDDLYEQIMEQGWNVQKQQFGQCYEETDVLDSSVLFMPLVFFIQPVSIFRPLPEMRFADAVIPQSDPRFLSTLKQVLKSPERGGLTSNVGAPVSVLCPRTLIVVELGVPL